MNPAPINVFKLREALRDVDLQEIDVGSIVIVTWVVPEAYGGQTRSHTGPLKFLDRGRGWFEIGPSNNSPGHFRSSIASGELTITKAEDQDELVSKPIKHENPFLRGEKEKKQPVKKRPTKPVDRVAMANPFLKGKN